MEDYTKEVAKHVGPGARILEVAPGPGYVSIALAKKRYLITGMDISADFIDICKRNAREGDVHVEFLQGNVSDIPFEGNLFDFIVCSAAFKNFKKPLIALQEMDRVLKPGGIALISDMNRFASNAAQDVELAKMNVQGLNRQFVKLSFRTFLKLGAYTKDGFKELLRQTKFSTSEIIESGMSLYVYCHK